MSHGYFKQHPNVGFNLIKLLWINESEDYKVMTLLYGLSKNAYRHSNLCCKQIILKEVIKHSLDKISESLIILEFNK